MKCGLVLISAFVLLALAYAGRPIKRCTIDSDCYTGCCLYDGSVSLDFGFCDNESTCSSFPSLPNQPSSSNQFEDEPSVRNRPKRETDENTTFTSEPPKVTTTVEKAPSKQIAPDTDKAAVAPSKKVPPTTSATTMAPSAKAEATAVTTLAVAPTTVKTTVPPTVITTQAPSAKVEANSVTRLNSTDASEDRNGIVLPVAPDLPVSLDIVNSFIKPFAPLVFATGFLALPIAILGLTVLAPPPFPKPKVEEAPKPKVDEAKPKIDVALRESPKVSAKPEPGAYSLSAGSRPAPAYNPYPAEEMYPVVYGNAVHYRQRPQFRRQKREGLLHDIIAAFK